MSEKAVPPSERRVLHEIPGMDAVTVQRDLEYRGGDGDGGPLALDAYHPPGSRRDDPLPAVIVVAGYPDPGFRQMVGCRFKDVGGSVSWGRLLGASGLLAITYENRDPAADLGALLRHLRNDAAALGVDAERIGLWASSGNVPLALSTLIDARDRPRCAALLYGYMLDLDGASEVAEAAKTFGFANPGAGRAVEDLPREVPLFVARAGLDQTPGLNRSLDRFLIRALAQNLPVRFVNHPTGPHAFDLSEASPTSREIVEQILAFLRAHLLPAPIGTRSGHPA